MSKKAACEVEVMPAAGLVTMPADPSWERARGYAESIRRTAEDVVRLGLELAALRAQWFAQGARNELRDTLSRSGPEPSEQGWQALVEKELGISHKTASRIIERADAIISLRRLTAGEEVVFTDTKTKETLRIAGTADAAQRAQALLGEIEAGTVSAPRALAGLVGECTRRHRQGGSAHRAAVDHAGNIRTALKKLKTSLGFWSDLDGQTRLELEDLWQEAASGLPQTWRK